MRGRRSYRKRGDALARLRFIAQWILVFLGAGGLPASENGDGTPASFLVQYWDTEQGLPAATVTGLAETKDGFLWVSTPRGLTRFDGAGFQDPPFAAMSLLRGKEIISTAGDGNGGLWVATLPVGLYHLTGEQCAPVAFGTNLPSRINFVVAHPGTRPLLGTSGQGVFRPTETGWNSSGFTDTSRIVVDGLGTVWSMGFGALAHGEGNHTERVQDFAPPDRRVTFIAPARRGGVWVVTTSDGSASQAKQLSYISPQLQVTRLPSYTSSLDNSRMDLTALCEDQAGNLWVGTYGGGVYYRPPGGDWTLLRTEGPLAELIVNVMQPSEDGSIWVGFYSGGLCQIRPRPVAALKLPPPARQNIVLAACASRDGSVWVATDGAGVFRYQQNVFTPYGPAEGLGSMQVGVLLEDRQTNLWAGTWGGLYRRSSNHFEQVQMPGVLSGPVQALLEDRQGRLWAGTPKGLVALEEGNARFYGPASGIPEGDIMALAEDHQGCIWAAIPRSGLFRLQGDRFEHFASGQWPEEAQVRSLFADGDSGLWVACYEAGLVRIKDGKFRRWGLADGLPDNGIHAIFEDDKRNLWFASNNGVFATPRSSLEQYVPGVDQPLLFNCVSVEDGMESKFCTGYAQPVVAQARDGRLWFPNRQTVAVFDPGNLQATGRARPAIIQQVLADGEPLSTGNEGRVRASSRTRRFEFRYTSPNLLAGGRLRFRYRLRGLEEDWVDAANQRTVFYRHLAPGSYEFQVAVSGPGGVWRETPAGLQLEVVPQWWERDSTRVAAALALVGGVAVCVWIVARARLRRKLQRLELRESLEKERRRIAQDLHDDVGSGLTEVVMLTEPIESEPGADLAVKNQLLASQKARQLIQAMKQIVWTVNPENDLLPSLADFLSGYVQEFLENAALHCRLDLPPELPPIQFSAQVRHEILLSVKEAVNNAVRHSRATEVWFRLKLENNELILSVEDNGIGFNPGTAARGGNGLKNMRSRLESLGGSCKIGPGTEGGTTVCFRIPIAAGQMANLLK